MLRKFASVVVVLVLCASVAMAADKKADKAKAKAKGKAVAATVESFDGTTLKVSVGKKGAKETKEFKITEKCAFVDVATKEKLSAGDAKAKLTKGAKCSIVADESGNVTAVRIGVAKKKKNK
jgi:hypothetical protein